MISRAYDLLAEAKAGKVTVLYGPRRVGKTTLLKDFVRRFPGKTRLDTGEDLRVAEVLSSRDMDKIAEYAAGFDCVCVDEAQHVPNIGLGLKMLIDSRPDLTIVATGSSSFDLAQKVGEPLVGRKKTLTLYPLSTAELRASKNAFDMARGLHRLLIYGGYPDSVLAPSDAARREFLSELVGSTLLKDILSLERVKSPTMLLDLLKLLAFQMGQLVSITELATALRINQKTVERYLDLLEKSFIIVRVHGYSRNLRKEITKKSKYYFLDNGVRNALIARFQAPGDRDDMGALWENFVVSERIKKREYERIYAGAYFWRTHDGQEVDLVEERDGATFGYECKWGTASKAKEPKDWHAAAAKTSWQTVTLENYSKFI